MIFYALTIFLGAFLLFQVQPLIGKYILPWFGGGPGVWTTCMLFFQVVLLGGYAYVHVTSTWLKPRIQALLHLLLLGVALSFLPITPDDSWKPQGADNPTGRILLLLTCTLGLPYFLLSTTGPLMQHWFSRSNPGRVPYRLYALSNIGSLLALLSFPFLFEREFTRVQQASWWGWGFVLFVIFCAVCALKAWDSPAALVTASGRDSDERSTSSKGSSRLDQLLWLLLPACASVLLLAVTNKICQDVAVIPFLWVLPLGLYLLSFIICFDNPRWYWRLPYLLAFVAAAGGICWALFRGTDASLKAQIGIYSGALFVCCMICHGELYRLRPHPRQLTKFYLMIALGGALGGIFVALIAPRVFTDFYELHLGLVLCALLAVWVCARRQTDSESRHWEWFAVLLTVMVFVGIDQGLAWLEANPPSLIMPHKLNLVPLRVFMWATFTLLTVFWLWRGNWRTFRHGRLISCLWMSLGVGVLILLLQRDASESRKNVLTRLRNFYGTLAVCEYNKDDPDSHYLLLQHGRITHGIQFMDSHWAREPVSYYGAGSGISLAIHALPERPRRIGVVGLGAGTMAAFARPGDTLRLYEINPDVLLLAGSRFTYLSNCAGKAEVIMGDGRLSLEHESPQAFDLLALDAFSSDAIPMHLLTREAFEVYQRHLAPHGIIAVHISNRYLDLEPVVLNLSREFDFHLACISYEEDEDEDDWWLYSSTWVLLSHSDEILCTQTISTAATEITAGGRRVPLWTDDFSSLFQVLK